MNHQGKKKPSPNKKERLRDREATKAEILDAAEEEFAKYGLAGAKIDAIAARTGVTKAMIYYYFKSKDALYQEVFQRLVRELNQMIQQSHLEQLPAAVALKMVIRSAIAYEASHPYRGRLWFHEAIQNQGKYGELTGWQDSFVFLMGILERGIAEGSFRQVDPFLTTINILGICVFYFDAQENLSYLKPDRQLLSQEMIEKQTQEVINLVLGGVLLYSENSSKV
ncbi:MAG: TetR/AcrR family transcriptional regulator [Okeania sp. SIO3B3]|nr:TetR/AcrR family transcriptional regulator [Okeania sp. SIO3B3]